MTNHLYIQNMIKAFVALLVILGLLGYATYAGAAGAVVVDHACTDITLIPEDAILQAKADLHIAYGHTSHGSQLTTGMSGLVGFMNDLGYPTDLYAYNSGGSGGALDLRDTPFSGASDLGNPDRTTWATATRNYLDAHPEVNIIIWSWCGQVSSASESDINTYLSLMSDLEQEYPDVQFVYMTGHLDGSGENGNLNLRNQQIRDYCSANGKILYDFADIESYDPDGLVHYMPLWANDNCDYDSDGDGYRDRNWATTWQDGHVEGLDWFSCSAAHSQALNGNRKAYAAWWLWARLAGWDGGQCVASPSGLTAVADSDANAIILTWQDNSADPQEDAFVIARQADGGLWDDAYAQVPAGTISYTDAELSPGTYAYRIVAHLDDDGSGAPCDSGPSSSAQAVIAEPEVIPYAPTELEAIGDSSTGEIWMSWIDNASVETGFVIERQVDEGAWVSDYAVLSANQTAYTDDNHGAGPLSSGTYAYRVAAFNDSGQSAYSNVALAVISHEPPAAPSNLTSDQSGFNVTLNWTDNADSEEAYVVMRKIDGGAFQVLDETLAPDTQSYTDSDLAPSHTYTYQVLARNNYGDSGYSNEAEEYIAEAVYNLTLKQGVEGYTGCRDAYLALAAPTYNYGGDLYNYVRDGASKTNFAIAFDVPEELCGKKILSATLGFYCWSVSSWSEGQYLDLYRLIEDWVEGSADGAFEDGSVSWNIREGQEAWTTAGGTCGAEKLGQVAIDSSAFYPEFDITGLVQSWADCTAANYGVLLQNDTDVVTGIKASEYSEYGRPYLEIAYTAASSCADRDLDGDVDGSDLALLATDNDSGCLSDLAAAFGH